MCIYEQVQRRQDWTGLFSATTTELVLRTYISSLYQRVLYFILYNFIPQPNHDFMSGEAITDQCVIMTHLCGPFHFISRAGSRPIRETWSA